MDADCCGGGEEGPVEGGFGDFWYVILEVFMAADLLICIVI